MICAAALSLALTAHINVQETNGVHPKAEFTCQYNENLDLNVGTYYNSFSKPSIYTTASYQWENNLFLEGGLVTGYYDGYAIPYGRIGYDFEKYNAKVFLAPAGNTDLSSLGAVIGVEFETGRWGDYK